MCWYLKADGKASVGAGSRMFLGFPETGTTGNFVSAEGRADRGSGLGQEPPRQKLFFIRPLRVSACLRRQVSRDWEELAQTQRQGRPRASR